MSISNILLNSYGCGVGAGVGRRGAGAGGPIGLRDPPPTPAAALPMHNHLIKYFNYSSDYVFNEY